VAVVCIVPSGNLNHPFIDCMTQNTESFSPGYRVSIPTFPS
jgi:hypothetical protein